ncbi:MAG: hypothetical protein LBQ66_15220 [Planctomycetaceae bacterium]|nr:hypothetical protein [Planctomycetaceae bacterium]
MFGSITHRGGRDARVPVRRREAAIVGYADVTARRAVDYLMLSVHFRYRILGWFDWGGLVDQRVSRSIGTRASLAHTMIATSCCLPSDLSFQ